MPVLGANYPFHLADVNPVWFYDDFIINQPPIPPVTEGMRLRDSASRQKIRVAVEDIQTNLTVRNGYGVWIKRTGMPTNGNFWMEWGYTATADIAPNVWYASSAEIDPANMPDQCWTFVYFADVVFPVTSPTQKYIWLVLNGDFDISASNFIVTASREISPEGAAEGFWQWNGTSWQSSGTNLYASGHGSTLNTFQRNIGQVFYVDRNMKLNHIKLALRRSGTLTGNVWLEVKPVADFGSVVTFWKPEYQITPYDPLSGVYTIKPELTVLASSRKIPLSSITQSMTTFDFVFDLSPVFEFGQYYAFVLKTDVEDMSEVNNIGVAADMTHSTFPDGTMIVQNRTASIEGGGVGGFYYMAFGDLVFEAYYDEATLLGEQLASIGDAPSDCGAMASWLNAFKRIIAGYFPAVLPESYGGTGESQYKRGDLLYAVEDNNLTRLPMTPNPGLVLSSGANGLPEWARGGGQVPQKYWNKTGSQLDPGDVVIYSNVATDPPGAIMPISANASHDVQFAGVLLEVIPNNAQGFVCTHGVCRVRLDGACSIGDSLFLSTVPKRVRSIPGAVGPIRALQAGTDGQLIWAFVNGQLPEIPTGAIQMWTTSTPPSGWLLCNGQEVSRTQYAKLFSVIGVQYGNGNGTTTFKLPDLRGRFPLGLDNMGGGMPAANRVTDAQADLLGGSGGAETHTLTINQMPSHQHDLGNTSDDGSGNFGGTSPEIGGNFAGKNTNMQRTVLTGGGQPHNNMPPWTSFAFIIKYA